MRSEEESVMNPDLIGEMFVAGIPGTELTGSDQEFLREVKPSGICLFARNIKEPRQVRDLTDSIRDILGRQTLICIDQEGGRVDRLRRIVEPMPPAENLRDRRDAEELGRISGLALRMLGININFAPVVDVPRDGTLPSENGLQTRMMGHDPLEVADKAKAFVEGSAAEGVLSCLKHFPGLGASTVDSHELLPVVDVGDTELEEIDLLPYRNLIPNQVDLVMIAHASYPNTIFRTESPDMPSSLNPKVYSYLRDSLQFRGLAVTDDLEMGAIVKSHGIPQAAVDAIESGADLALICNDQGAVRKAKELAISRLQVDSRIQTNSIQTSQRLSAVRSRLMEPVDFNPDEWEHLSRRIREFKETLS